MPYLGDILIDVIRNEDLTESSETTDHALEDGEQISDHVNHKPIELNVSGYINDPSDEKLLKIRKYREDKKILTYRYRNHLKKVLITSFNSNKSAKTAEGYEFDMTLKQIRFVKAPSVVSVSPSTKRQAKTVSNKGKQKVKKMQKAPPKKVTSKGR